MNTRTIPDHANRLSWYLMKPIFRLTKKLAIPRMNMMDRID